MDAFMAEVVSGLFGVLVLLIGGLGYMYRQDSKAQAFAQKMFRDELKHDFQELRALVEKDYLPREQHMKAHQQLQDTCGRQASRMNAMESDVAGLKHDFSDLRQRITKLERRQ